VKRKDYTSTSFQVHKESSFAMFNLWGSSQQDQKTKEAYAESKVSWFYGDKI
jgi:hypothetical protein